MDPLTRRRRTPIRHLLIAWVMGAWIYFWIRAKQWFARYVMLLYTLALLVPVLALLGFAEAGKELASDPTGFGAPSAHRLPAIALQISASPSMRSSPA